MLDPAPGEMVSGSGYFRIPSCPGFESLLARGPCEHRSKMLAALNLGAVALGVATGALTASLAALLLSGLLTLVGLEAGADIGLVAGVVVGLAAGGWVAGGRAVHSQRFHGMVTGLLLAFVVIVIARLGGSPAPTWVVIWLALLSVAISGLAGWLAGRRGVPAK